MANEIEVRRGREVAPRRALPTLDRMDREMDRLFSDFFGDGPRFLWPRWWPGGVEAYQAPVVDVYEEKDHIG